MSEQARYSLIPGLRQAQGGVETLLIINGTPVRVVPAGSCLLLLVGLIMWAVGMLQARSTVDGIFSDLGVEAASLEHLKVSVLAGVIVLSLLVLAALAANAWLEATRSSSSNCSSSSSSRAAGGPTLTPQVYATNAFRLNVCNWVLLLLVALAMAGSITWLTTMSAALSAAQDTGGGGYGRGVAGLANTSPTTSSSGSSSSSTAAAGPGPYVPTDVGQVWASSSSSSSSSSSNSVCPPGCVDLGLIAQVLGLPWPCFCQVWLLGDLLEQLHKVVGQLWVAVTGALLLFAATSWLYGYLAAQGALAGREGGPQSADAALARAAGQSGPPVAAW